MVIVDSKVDEEVRKVRKVVVRIDAIKKFVRMQIRNGL